jgi:hypothetical protein
MGATEIVAPAEGGRRLYSAYMLGAVWGLGVEFVAVWMYVSPWWKPVATVLIGR